MKQKLLSSFRLRVVMLVAILCSVFTGTMWGNTEVTWPATTALPGTATAVANDPNITIKTSSTNTYTSPLRIYANTTVTIEANNGAKILSVAYEASSTGNYVTYAKDATVSPSVTPTVSSKIVTWSYNASANVTKFTFKPSDQTRSNGITITYTIPETYTVSYAANGGSGTMTDSNSPYVAGATVTLLENTFTAPTGNKFNDWTVKDASNNTVSVSNNQFTMPASNVTVTAQWQVIPAYTVTLGDDNTTLTESSAGAGVTLPSRNNTGNYTFAGWSVTNVDSETTTAPTIIPAGNYNPTDNITLYPVYTRTEGSGTTTEWHLTELNAVSEGVYALLTEDYYAFNGSISSGHGQATSQAFSFTNGKATTAPAGVCEITFKAVTGGFKMYNSEKGYLYASAASSGSLAWHQTENSYWSYASTNWKYNSNGAYLRSYSNSSFRTYGTNNGQLLKLAKKVEVSNATTYYYSSPVAAAVENPVITLAENPFLFSTTVTITCPTDGAAIKYSYDNATWQDYSSPFTITETKTIYAKGVKGNDESYVVSVEATKNLATPTVTVNGDLTTVDLNGSTDVNAGILTASVTYNNAAIEGATVNWSSSDNAIATIDNSGVVTIKAAGQVTFTATYAGNSDYAETAGTKTFTITDSQAKGGASNPYTVAEIIALNPTSTSVAVKSDVYVKGFIVGSYNDGDYSKFSTASTTQSVLALADNYNETTYSNTIPVELKSGSDIRNAFNVNSNAHNVGVAQIVIKGDVLKYYGAPGIKNLDEANKVAEQVSISVAGMATYYTDCALDFTNKTNMYAYYATLSGSTITFTRINGVPANTGVLLRNPNGGDASNLVPVLSGTPETLNGTNAFVGTLTAIDALTGEGKYILNNGSNGLGFYLANGQSVGVHRAYLNAGSSARSFIGFGEETTTGIDAIENGNVTIDNVYDLQGRRVAQPSKGLYIMNGKKVIFK